MTEEFHEPRGGELAPPATLEGPGAGTPLPPTASSGPAPAAPKVSGSPEFSSVMYGVAAALGAVIGFGIAALVLKLPKPKAEIREVRVSVPFEVSGPCPECEQKAEETAAAVAAASARVATMVALEQEEPEPESELERDLVRVFDQVTGEISWVPAAEAPSVNRRHGLAVAPDSTEGAPIA